MLAVSAWSLETHILGPSQRIVSPSQIFLSLLPSKNLAERKYVNGENIPGFIPR